MNDQLLLARYVKDKDPEAFRELVLTYQGLVYSACYRRLDNAADVDEAVQDVFLSLAKNAATIKKNLAAWLHACALNTATAKRRSDTARKTREQKSAEQTHAHTIADKSQNQWNEIKDVFDICLDELKPDDREIIIQHFFQNKSQKEIAAQLGIAQQAVSKRLIKAIDLLRIRISKRDITITTLALTTIISTQTLTHAAVPIALTAGIMKIGLVGVGSTSLVATTATTLTFATKLKIATTAAALAVSTTIIATNVKNIPQYQGTPLTAHNVSDFDSFGSSVAIDNQHIVIGAAHDDDNGTFSGSAYIFDDDGTGFRQTAKLRPYDPATPKGFGFATDIHNDNIIISAFVDHRAFATPSGTAYIFKSTNRGWTQSAKLTSAAKPSYKTNVKSKKTTHTHDSFGHSVSISQNTAAVGAPRDYVDNITSGSVFIFQQNQANWKQTKKLIASDGMDFDEFGSAVAIDQNIIIVGAPGVDDLGSHAGAAYIFIHKPDGTWTQTDKILASDGDQAMSFGCSVAIDGDQLVVGSVGAAYVYQRAKNNHWTQSSKLTAHDHANKKQRWSVSISDDTIIAGSIGDSTTGDLAGAAFLFRRHDKSWKQTAKLIGNSNREYDRFGVSVGVSQNTIIVGASDAVFNQRGSAFIFNSPSDLPTSANSSSPSDS